MPLALPYREGPILAKRETRSYGDLLRGNVACLDLRDGSGERGGGNHLFGVALPTKLGAYSPAKFLAIVNADHADSLAIGLGNHKLAGGVGQRGGKPIDVFTPRDDLGVDRVRPRKRIITPFVERSGVVLRGGAKCKHSRTLPLHAAGVNMVQT